MRSAGPPPASAAGNLIAPAAPRHAPAAAARSTGREAPAATASIPTAAQIASASLCAPDTSWNSSSGLHVHSSAARIRPSGVRHARCSTRPVSTNASAFVTDSANTVNATDSPPTQEANACCAVAIGPYTDGAPRHSCTASAIGSPGMSTARVAYGSCPVTTIRP